MPQEQETEDGKTITNHAAYGLLLEARAQMNRDQKPNTKAFDLLSEAVKLDPHLTDAWIELSTCYEKKTDIEGAITCLETALEVCEPAQPNKVILRKLSTCIRQRPCDSQEAKISSLLRSLELSKQALKSDLHDEENYYNLAKAYMCLFFVTECVDQRLINLSRSAFAKALELSKEKRKRDKMNNKDEPRDNPSDTLGCTKLYPEHEQETKPYMMQADFLFNYSTVLIYLQDFQMALDLIEVSITLEPAWEEPKLLKESLVDYLKQTHSMIGELSRHPKRVIKRFSKMVDLLKNVSSIENLIELDQRRLIKSQDVELEVKTLAQLRQAQQSEGLMVNAQPLDAPKAHINIMHLKLLEIISYNQAMYLTFVAIDREYNLIVVTIYNLAASRSPTQKDVITILEPKIERIEVERLRDSMGKIHDVSFDRINVREFRELYVNGFRISVDQVSKPQFRVSIIP